MKIIAKDIHKSLSTKLHPKNFTDMSAKMAFILSAILGTSWATGPQGEEPSCTYFTITSDKMIVSGNMFIGDARDLENNISNLLSVAELTEEEEDLFYMLYDKRVKS